MFEKLDKLRDEVKRCEKRRDDANERLKAAQAKLKDAEASQILSDVGALKLSPEEVAKLLQLAATGQLGVPNAESISDINKTSSKDEFSYGSYTERKNLREEESDDRSFEDKEDSGNEEY